MVLDNGSYTLGWIVGGLMVVLGLGAYLNHSEAAASTALIIFVLAWLVARIWILVAAFSFSLGTGLLTLCLPFYEIYFMFFVSTNKTMRGLWLATWIPMTISSVLSYL